MRGQTSLFNRLLKRSMHSLRQNWWAPQLWRMRPKRREPQPEQTLMPGAATAEGKSFTCQRERERLVAIGDPPGCLQLVHAQPVLHYSELDVLFVRATVLLTSATPRPSRSCRFLPIHPEREPEYSAEIC